MDFNSYRSEGEKCDKCTEENVRATYDRYGNMQREDVLSALYEEVNREKSRGVFDINRIWSFYRSIAPMLSEEERERMRDVISAMEQR